MTIMTSHRRPIGLSALAASLILIAGPLTGCGAGEGASPSVVPEVGMAAPAEQGMAGDAAAPEAKLQQSIITSGSVSVLVSDVAASAAQVRSIVQSAKGQIDGENEYVNPQDDQDRTVNLTIRVPAESFASVDQQISDLGTVESRSISRTDVTIQVVDTDARIAALESSISRLLALVDQAQTTADLIEAENALTARQSELDSLKSQKAYLADQVAMSSMQVTLSWSNAAREVPWPLILLVIGLIVGAGTTLLIWLIVASTRRGRPKPA